MARPPFNPCGGHGGPSLSYDGRRAQGTTLRPMRPTTRPNLYPGHGSLRRYIGGSIPLDTKCLPRRWNGGTFHVDYGKLVRAAWTQCSDRNYIIQADSVLT
jgi:hypothetical protein